MEEVRHWCENFSSCDLILKYQPQYYVIASLCWILSILNLLSINTEKNIIENDIKPTKSEDNEADISDTASEISYSSPSSVTLASSLMSELELNGTKRKLSLSADASHAFTHIHSLKPHKSLEDPHSSLKIDRNTSKINLSMILSLCFIDSVEELIKTMCQLSQYLPYLLSKKFAHEFSLLQYDLPPATSIPGQPHTHLTIKKSQSNSTQKKLFDLREIKINEKMTLETINKEITKTFSHVSSSPSYLNPLKRTFYTFERKNSSPVKKKIRRQYSPFLIDRA